MSTVPNTVAAQEVKRRGVRAILERLDRGPVHILQQNRPAFVALKEEQFQELVEELEMARIQSSLADIEGGRVRYTSAREILQEITE